MPFDAHANFAVSTVGTAPSPATTGVTIIVAAGEGARFPAVPFNATVCPAASAPTPATAEIVRVTARSVDTLTITRAQEGSTARAILAGDLIAATITAKSFSDLEVNPTFAGQVAAGTFAAGTIPATVGHLRLPSGGYIYGRNAANTADINLLSHDTANNMQLGASGQLIQAAAQVYAPGVRLGTSPAGSGVLGLPNNAAIFGRNAANSADVAMAYIDTANAMQIGPGQGVNINASGFINSPTQPRCLAQADGTQQIQSAVWTALNLQTEAFDVGGLHAGSSSRLIVPTGGDGVYLAVGNLSFGSSTVGTRYIQIGGIASTMIVAIPPGDIASYQLLGFGYLAAGGYAEILGFQNSGGPLSLNGSVGLLKLW